MVPVDVVPRLTAGSPVMCIRISDCCPLQDHVQHIQCLCAFDNMKIDKETAHVKCYRWKRPNATWVDGSTHQIDDITTLVAAQ